MSVAPNYRLDPIPPVQSVPYDWPQVMLMNDIDQPQPQCPKCLETMHPALRMASRATPRLRVGSLVPPPILASVCRCSACGSDAPRVDEAA